MLTIAVITRTAAQLVNYYGRWTGDQFQGPQGELDIAAAYYVAATGRTPDAFLTDEDASLALIRANPYAMAAIELLSACLATLPPPMSATDPAPDHIEHICRWAAEPALGEKYPPTVCEVIGRLERAARSAEALQATPAGPAPHAA